MNDDTDTTTPPENETSAVQVEVVDEGPCRKRLRVSVSPERVTEELDTNYRQLRQTIQMPGFRKGKVPLSVLKGRFGKKIEAEVQEEMISSTFFDEVQNRELRVIGAPSFENIEFSPGDPLTYEAAIEIAPDFPMPEYKGLTVEALPIEVGTDEVEEEISSILDQHATLEPVGAGEQAEEDLAVCTVEIVDSEGNSLFERPEVYLKIGLDQVDNIEVAGMGEKLVGAAAEDQFEFPVDVPDDFPIEEARGGGATLKIRFHEAKRKQLPALDEEFLGNLGVDSEDALRSEIEKSLETRRRLQEEHRQEEVLVEKLLDSVEMEFPPSVLERRTEEISMGRRFHMMREGKSQEEIEADMAGKSDEVESEARTELKRIFVLDRIAEEENALVTEDEIGRRITAIAMTQQRSPDEVFEEYQKGGRLDELRQAMRREKVREVLRKRAKIEGASTAGTKDAAEDSAEDDADAESSADEKQ